MSHRSNRIALCTLAAAASFGLANPAQAGFIGTRFDPTFFDGVGTFFVPDSPCLGLSDGFHSVNPGSEGCSGVVLVSASVNVDHGTGSVHLSLPPPTPSGTDITGIVLDSEALSTMVGVNSVPIPIGVDPGTCTGDLCGFLWFIQWDSGLSGEGGELSNQVLLYRYCFEGPGCGTLELFGDPATDVKFFLTPEPGSLALLFGALGAGWLVRRRRVAG